MDADKFVRAVAAAGPYVDELVNGGLPEEDAREVRIEFEYAPRGAPGARQADPILDLIARYDCSRCAPLMVSFVGAPQQHGDYTLVGNYEADWLALAPSGAVVLLDHARRDVVLLTCARDSAAFLAALARSLDEKNPQNRGVEAAGLAGGPEYAPFWRMVNGAPRSDD